MTNTIMKSEIERRRHRRAVNTLGRLAFTTLGPPLFLISYLVVATTTAHAETVSGSLFLGGTVGNGGNATSTATANASRGNSATALSNATGRAGGSGPNNSTAGTANATSSATAAGSGQASAQAVVSGASAGAATATSTSNSGAGPSVSASASAPVGGNATAKTLSYFGGSGFGLPGITAGTSISDVTGQPRHFSLTPNVLAAFGHGTVDALGAMSIGYGGNGQSLTYQTTASFQFAHPANSDFLLGLMSQGSLGTGFDSATLEVFVNSMLAYEQSSWSL